MDTKSKTNKIDIFMTTIAPKYLPNNKFMIVREQLEELDESKLMMLQTLEYKNPATILILAILLGWFGVDRFVLGEVKLGIFKLVSDVIFAIWWIIDWFTAMKRAREWNYNMLMNFIQ